MRYHEGPYLVGSSGTIASHIGDRRLPIREAMVAPLDLGDGAAGLIVVANPLGVHDFDSTDLDLLGTLAGQVGDSRSARVILNIRWPL